MSPLIESLDKDSLSQQEARVGLGLRLVFGLQPELLALARVGSHEDVRRFLREL